MKRFYYLLLVLLLLSQNDANARCHGHYHYYSSPAYVVRSDYFENEQNFADCDLHYLLTRTTVNFYSNGARRTYYSYDVYNNDGVLLLENCADVQHVVYNKQHYFLFRKNGKYFIANSKGEVFAKRKYTRMYVISEGRILVRVDKKYGVIDLQENILVPIKYKTFEKLGENLYLTKLNGYYGILDSKGKIVLKNEYDSIKPLYDTFVLKKCGKYGLADINGKLIFLPYCDKIKKLGEYILVKNNGLYSVCSSTGEVLNDKEYKKIRLERNTLEGKLKGDKYQPIETDI
jgi:hypothetical protein